MEIKPKLQHQPPDDGENRVQVHRPKKASWIPNSSCLLTFMKLQGPDIQHSRSLSLSGKPYVGKWRSGTRRDPNGKRSKTSWCVRLPTHGRNPPNSWTGRRMHARTARSMATSASLFVEEGCGCCRSRAPRLWGRKAKDIGRQRCWRGRLRRVGQVWR